MTEHEPDAREIVHAFLERVSEDRAQGLERSLGEYQALYPGHEATIAREHANLHHLGTTLEGVPPRESDIARDIGPYRLLSVLGEGGMGVVYLAEQTGAISRRVALKVIKLGMDTREIIARFESERQVLALMSHSHIAKVFDAGTTQDGRPYFVMELVAGVPITAYCDQESLTIGERIKLFAQVCEGVQHAHQKGVIHRDIKPSNVLVTSDGDQAVVKIIDFGIARSLQKRLTEKTFFTEYGTVIGTPEYMSPEQADATVLDIDTRTDIYSLGVLLYELVVGALPFDSAGLRAAGYAEILRCIREVDPPRPSTRLRRLGAESSRVAERRRTGLKSLVRELQGDLDWIVIKALEKNRTRRYASASELAADLARHLADEPVEASPPSAVYKLRKLYRRNRAAVQATVMVLLVLTAGLVATTVMYLRSETERGEKEEALRTTDIALTEKTAALAQTAQALAARTAALVEKDSALRRSEGMRLVAHSQSAALENSELRLLLRIEAAQRAPGPIANSALASSLEEIRESWTLEARASEQGPSRFSPDGRRVLTVSADNSARIWDAESGRGLLMLIGHTDELHCGRFSPDGKRILTTSADKTARIWDAQNGRELAILHGHAEPVISGQWSPDGERVLTGSFDGTARIWDAEGGREVFAFRGHTDRLISVIFSPDGQRVLTASSDNTARIWDAKDGRKVFAFVGHTEGLYTASFSPDGGRVVTASADGTSRIWDAGSGEEKFVLGGDVLDGGGRRGEVYTAIFSPDGQRVLTASSDNTARIWDAGSGRQLLTLHGHTDGLFCGRFSPDGKRILTTSADHTARIWDAQDGREIETLRGHNGWVISGRWSPDGSRIVTDKVHAEAKIWNATRTPSVLVLRGHNGSVDATSFSPDGGLVLTASRDDARIWDSESGREVMVLGGHAEEETMEGAQFSPDGQRVLTKSTATARIWDVANGRELLTLDRSTGGITVARFRPDSKRILIGSDDGTAAIWDADSGQQHLALRGHSDSISDARYGPHGKRVLTASRDKTARVWNAESGERICLLLGHTKRINRARFSPDGERVLTASGDKTARIWNAESGREIRLLVGHTEEIDGASFSPDGKRVLTASDDGTARIWSADTGEEILTIRGTFWSIRSARFSPDGMRVLTAGITPRIWDAKSGEVIRSLLGHEMGLLDVGPLSVAFSPDGERVLTGARDRTARIWPVDVLAAALTRKPRDLTPDEVERFEIGTREERRAYAHEWDTGRLRASLALLLRQWSAGATHEALRLAFVEALKELFDLGAKYSLASEAAIEIARESLASAKIRESADSSAAIESLLERGTVSAGRSSSSPERP